MRRENHRLHLPQRAGCGSLTGRWTARSDGLPNIHGGITLERDMKAGSRLWVRGWTRVVGTKFSGIEHIVLELRVAVRGPRSRRRYRTDEPDEPEGKFRCKGEINIKGATGSL